MQLSICEPYPASLADYHVLEVEGPVVVRGKTLADSVLQGWSLVDKTSDHSEAFAVAREHCVRYGHEVWVIDMNDGQFVVLRVAPGEYAAPAPLNYIPASTQALSV